ncbi:hypothetical protein [Streptosporangium sp. NPDC051022]|uniref:SEL1-like repeat protein n=1 Tax=Streptosporangium sp. NPDC051022 TaxID=3155752 RepID=UPI003433EF86
MQVLGQQPGPWRAARARLVTAARAARADKAPDPAWPAAAPEPLGRAIGELDERDALVLEVHQAFAAAGGAAEPVAVLPPYLLREGFDDRLRAAVADAAGGSRLVMVIGGSSTGKTRACWEAIRAVMPGWRIWHPLTPERPMAVVEALRGTALAPRTVIWLNEAQFYLQAPQAGGSVATELQALLSNASRGSVLVLGSMWPDYWRLLTATSADPASRDPHRAARALLGRAEEITCPHRFTDRHLADLTGMVDADSRLRVAVRRALGGQITQELAGAPELLRRYRHADPAEQAVLWAAIDARRLGHSLYLSEPFLQHAAPGYLDDHTWDQIGGQEDWFTTALDRLTARHRRLPGPLIEHRVRPGEPPSAQLLYRLADYLEQHGRDERGLLCPPTTFWEAAARHAHTSTDLTVLADEAYVRGRYRHAHHLAQRAADAGDPHALRVLANMREQMEDQDGAERMYRQAADAGDRGAMEWLAKMLEEAGDRDGAERFAQRAADAGNTNALWWLADMREQMEERDGAERMYRQAANAGDCGAMRWLAKMLEEAGDRDGAERFAQRAADAGDTNVLCELAEMRKGTVAWRSAERLYRQAADADDFDALWEPAEMREEAEDWERTERLIQRAADAGNPGVMRKLVELREAVGDREGAERFAQRAADAGDPYVMGKLAMMREKAGDRESAERLAQRAADAGDTNVLWELTDTRERAGDQEGAERLYRLAADTGHVYALWILAQAREGDREDAERLYRLAADTGYPFVLRGLAEMRERAGDREEAERLAQRAVDAGDPDALRTLAWLRKKAGDQDGAKRLVRFGLTAEGEIEAPWSQ